MRRADLPLGKGRHLVFLITALAVVAADQLTKEFWIRAYTGEQPMFKAGFFRIIYTENTGASFGILPDQFLLLTITGFIGIGLVLLFNFYFSRHYQLLDDAWGKLVLGLILGGAIGNLIDRIRFGFVTDFISVGWWPVFNIADSAVVVGTILFAYLFLFVSEDGILSKSKPGK